MSALLDWLDDRTGYRALAHEALYERIPGGARWRYVWGSTLVFAFSAQVITGLFLWMAYSPSAQTAWESVFYIQFEMQGGWLLRGLHHFMAQLMVVLLALHLLQVVIDGAYRAPREVNFWVGLILMQIVLGLSLTGYLLPWDQKGYWATKVATNIMGIVPVVGPSLQRLAVGGGSYGHQTLTRFFALHAGVLPGLLIFFLVVHIYVFRRHGIHAKNASEVDGSFWPDQVFKDAVACLAVLAVVLLLVIWRGGAELGAPADAARPYDAARPEWYFLFLFQFLKYFHGESQEILGAIVIPGVVMTVLALMPFVGRWKLGHGFNIAFLMGLLVGIGALTGAALNADRQNERYREAVADAHADAERAIALAEGQGIPPSGAISLVRNDPKIEGRYLFKQNCATCHLYQDAKGVGLAAPAEPKGSNLHGFASRQWIAGLLNPEQVAGPNYFGHTKHVDQEMVNWVKDNVAEIDKAELEKGIMALSAQAKLVSQRAADAKDAEQIAAGAKLIKEKFGCVDCHPFEEAGEGGTAPNLTGYGSREWLIEFVKNPGHERFYGDNHQMPAFDNVRTPREIELIVDWLRGEWYEPGSPAPAGDARSAPPLATK
jgi:ubiquinol-cytochrome c reductase cytochrome b subunit